MAQKATPSDNEKRLLAQLLPLINEPDFSELFQRITQTESNNTRFLLKMELNRLNTPCQRLIDFRGKVDADCSPFIHNGLTHYLDPTGIQYFEEALTTFGGRYTLGVYEKTLSTPTLFSLIAKKQNTNPEIAISAKTRKISKDSSKKYLAKVIEFANIHGRNEERLHLAVPILAGLPSGTRLQVSSSNISPTGLKIKVPENMPFKKGTILHIYLTGLEKEFANNILKVGIPYKVMGNEKKAEQQWLRLMLMDDFEEYSEFKTFLQQFLESYKGRYRVDVKNLTKALTIRGFEQYYLPKMSALPLFFSIRSGQQHASLDTVLSNEYNSSQLDYWRDEHNCSQLPALFSPSRLKYLREAEHDTSLLIYCFSYTLKGRIFFYSASMAELEKTGLKNSFFAFGSRRPSWKVYQLSLFDINISNALVSLNVALNPQEKQHSNKFTQDKIEKKLATYCFSGFLQEIHHDKLEEHYQDNFKTIGDANLLKCFVHKSPQSKAQPFDTVALKYVQMRREDRFSYKTSIILKNKEHQYKGWSNDFSTKGMKVELLEAAHFQRGDVIQLSMPKFDKLSKTAHLIDLPYEVVNFNQTQTIINLKVVETKEEHQGKKFLANLINMNKSKLNIIPEKAPMAGLSEALRNISCQGIPCLPFYVHKRIHHLTIDTVGRSGASKPFATLTHTEDDKVLDLSAFLSKDLFKRLIAEPLKAAEIGSAPSSQELYIAWQGYAPNKTTIIELRLSSDFSSEEEKKLFVAKALQTGEFSSVLVSLSRTGRPDMDYISNELAYISQYALHKAKELEDNLWSVAGVGEFIDTTAETCARLALRKPSI